MHNAHAQRTCTTHMHNARTHARTHTHTHTHIPLTLVQSLSRETLTDCVCVCVCVCVHVRVCCACVVRVCVCVCARYVCVSMLLMVGQMGGGVSLKFRKWSADVLSCGDGSCGPVVELEAYSLIHSDPFHRAGVKGQRLINKLVSLSVGRNKRLRLSVRSFQSALLCAHTVSIISQLLNIRLVLQLPQ